MNPIIVPIAVLLGAAFILWSAVALTVTGLHSLFVEFVPRLDAAYQSLLIVTSLGLLVGTLMGSQEGMSPKRILVVAWFSHSFHATVALAVYAIYSANAPLPQPVNYPSEVGVASGPDESYGPLAIAYMLSMAAFRVVRELRHKGHGDGKHPGQISSMQQVRQQLARERARRAARHAGGSGALNGKVTGAAEPRQSDADRREDEILHALAQGWSISPEDTNFLRERRQSARERGHGGR